MAGNTSKRTIAIVVAVVLAAVATVALISYVNSAKDRAVKQQQPVDVYVAKDTIAQGTLGSDAISKGLIIKRATPRVDVAKDAITSLSQIQNKVANVDILPDEQILGPRFVDPATLRSGLLPIPADKQAISVQVDVPPGVAGFIRTGDTVSILGEINNQELTKFFLQDVQVLSVGASAAAPLPGAKPTPQPTPAAAGQGGTVLLTLAVSPADAEKVAFAVLNGRVYFTLVPNGQKPANTSGVNPGNLFP